MVTRQMVADWMLCSVLDEHDIQHYRHTLELENLKEEGSVQINPSYSNINSNNPRHDFRNDNTV